MKRDSLDERRLRREALTTRAALQRIEATAAVRQLRRRSTASKSLGGVALGLARSLAGARSRDAGTGRGPRPWLLSAGILLVRALRVSPTMRWVAGAAAVGGAIWWVARALRTPDSSQDDSG